MADYFKLWTDCDQKLSKEMVKNYKLRDENSVLRMQIKAVIAYVAGEGNPQHRGMVKNECLRRWKKYLETENEEDLI